MAVLPRMAVSSTYPAGCQVLGKCIQCWGFDKVARLRFKSKPCSPQHIVAGCLRLSAWHVGVVTMVAVSSCSKTRHVARLPYMLLCRGLPLRGVYAVISYAK